MKILANIPFELDIEVLKKKFHIKSNCGYEQCLEDIIQAVREVGNPKAVLKESYIDSRIGDSVIIDNVRFTGKVLRKNLDKVERVFPYVATCGTELDNIKINSDDLLEEYILDSIKEILLRESVAFLDKYIYKRYGIQKTASMNPGSSDLVWPIEQQKELFTLFPDIENAIGVELTESCLMIPNKTVSGMKFPTDTDFHNCRLCKRERCPTRVEPFDEKLLAATIKSMDI
jgi:hypothetical protein